MTYQGHGPSIEEGCFKAAISKTRKKHSRISEDTARRVLFKYFERWNINEQKTYDKKGTQELRSLTLNELGIFAPYSKQYHSLISHYVYEYNQAFGKKDKPTKQVSPLPMPCHTEKNGQVAWSFDKAAKH